MKEPGLDISTHDGLVNVFSMTLAEWRARDMKAITLRATHNAQHARALLASDAKNAEGRAADALLKTGDSNIDALAAESGARETRLMLDFLIALAGRRS